MWSSNSKGIQLAKKNGRNGLTAIAIDKDKSSQHALRWTVENLLSRGQTVILIHVLRNSSTNSAGNAYAVNDETGAASAHQQHLEKITKELFLTFHCFCTRKEIQCYDVVLEDSDIAKAITEYVSQVAIEHLVLGSSRQGFIRLLKSVDVPTSTIKLAPDFCSLYVISKTKLSSVRNASRSPPFTSPLLSKFNHTQDNASDNSPRARPKHTYSIRDGAMTPRKPPFMRDDAESIRSPFFMAKYVKDKPHTEYSQTDSEISFRSPFSYGSGLNWKQHGELSETESDISFISSNRPSTATDLSFISSNRPSTDRMSVSVNDNTTRLSTSSASSIGSGLGSKASEASFMQDYSSSSLDSDDAESEMRRLKLELQKTMQLYSAACKEALSAKEMAAELHRWRLEEERKLQEARISEGGGSHTATSTDSAEGASDRIANLESKKRVSEEMKSWRDTGDQHSMPSPSSHHIDFRYRRYTIDEIEEATDYFSESNKIGEGGYGPVFKCRLDHTSVAVKVLRPDANQGKSQFNREVEVLSCMRHPHMVLLLGACPEYGCLVYEYMANGSLEDRLLRRGNTPVLPWQLRFRIAAEIATGLLFFHRTKPEPIVHRDLKPANILLDHNFVSKIGDVGLARLVPPSVADDVTQYRMTSAAGTFCYIDPEYQQTGMLGVKSDVYSFGIILLQVLTAKPAMGITHHIERAIEKGVFKDVLDASVEDWPIDEALDFAKLGLQCAELRRKDRPDLGNYVLPELDRLRDFAEQNMTPFFMYSQKNNS